MTAIKANCDNKDDRCNSHPQCFGKMLSVGFSDDCDVCSERLSCLDETNRRLKQEEKGQSLEVFEVKYCPAEGECSE